MEVGARLEKSALAPIQTPTAGSLLLPDWFDWKRRPREHRPCIQAADVSQSHSSLVLLVEWRDAGATRRASLGSGPGAAVLVPAHPTRPSGPPL